MLVQAMDGGALAGGRSQFVFGKLKTGNGRSTELYLANGT